MSVRTEDEDDKAPGAEDEGKQPSGKCDNCGMQNRMEAKFCDQCGESMEAKSLEDDDDDPPPSSKPPASDRKADAHPPPPERMSTEASIAGILGASSDNVPAVKTAAINLRQIRDTAAALTGKTDPGEIVGALLTIPSRLAAGDKAAAQAKVQAKETEKRERWDLARRLNALGLDGRPRSSIFDDKVDASGKRAAVSLMPEYARMDLGVLRGLVEGFERSAPTKRRNPFEPDPSAARAEAAARKLPSASDEPTPAQLAEAKQWPAVRRMANAPGQTRSLDDLAKAAWKNARTMGGAL